MSEPTSEGDACCVCVFVANTDLAALEVTPGSLLRVTTSTGDKFFSQAAMTLDPVGTAGHLVSMVVADGIRNAPTALLANHMESSLAAAVARVGKTVCVCQRGQKGFWVTSFKSRPSCSQVVTDQ